MASLTAPYPIKEGLPNTTSSFPCSFLITACQTYLPPIPCAESALDSSLELAPDVQEYDATNEYEGEHQNHSGADAQPRGVIRVEPENTWESRWDHRRTGARMQVRSVWMRWRNAFRYNPVDT